MSNRSPDRRSAESQIRWIEGPSDRRSTASMTWMWLALFRLVLSLVLGYWLNRALAERLLSITRWFQALP